MAQNHPSPGPSGIARLTKRERECLELVNQGLQSKPIANILGIEASTVDARIKSACAKLGANTRHLAAKMLAESGRRPEDVTVTELPTILASPILELPDGEAPDDKEAAAREGNGLAASEQKQASRPGRPDSGGGKSWLRESRPYAAFLGGTNNRSTGQIIIDVLVTAAILLLGAGVFFNAFIGLSEMFKTP